MPTFTRPDGTLIEIDAAVYARAHASFDWEVYGDAGPSPTTLSSPRQVVREALANVGAALRAERASWIVLSGLEDRQLWFDAAKARDARAPQALEVRPGVNAVIPIDGVTLKVTETVEEAQAAIDAAKALI